MLSKRQQKRRRDATYRASILQKAFRQAERKKAMQEADDNLVLEEFATEGPVEMMPKKPCSRPRRGI